MNRKPVILIIIPVYNEKEIIRSVITDLLAHSYVHFVVIDDGSDQDIFEEIKDLPIYYIRHAVNLGQGAALQTGFDFARQLTCDVVVTFDADGQHDHRDLLTLVAPVLSGEAQIVFGSRFIGTGGAHVPRTRKFILKCARYLNYFLSGILLTDAHNGLRAFHPQILPLLRLTENRMAHATEILYEVKKHQLSYCEVGVNIRYTPYAIKKGQRDWNSIKIFTDLVLHKVFGSSSK